MIFSSRKHASAPILLVANARAFEPSTVVVTSFSVTPFLFLSFISSVPTIIPAVFLNGRVFHSIVSAPINETFPPCFFFAEDFPFCELSRFVIAVIKNTTTVISIDVNQNTTFDAISISDRFAIIEKSKAVIAPIAKNTSPIVAIFFIIDFLEFIQNLR